MIIVPGRRISFMNSWNYDDPVMRTLPSYLEIQVPWPPEDMEYPRYGGENMSKEWDLGDHKLHQGCPPLKQYPGKMERPPDFLGAGDTTRDIVDKQNSDTKKQILEIRDELEKRREAATRKTYPMGDGSPPITEDNLKRLLNVKPKHVCHVREIPKGVVGEFSKITEEYNEALDAHEQGNKVMLLIEFADILGAIERFLVKNIPGVTVEDVIAQMRANHKLFDAGVRTGQ